MPQAVGDPLTAVIQGKTETVHKNMTFCLNKFHVMDVHSLCMTINL